MIALRGSAIAVGAALMTITATVHADPDADPLGFHGSVGGGGSVLVSGTHGGSHLRVGGELDVMPGAILGPLDHFGAMLALRDADAHHRGNLCTGWLFEIAGARPQLAIDLHGEIGYELDDRKPTTGAGLRTTIRAWRVIGVALDGGGTIVVDGLDHSRFVLEGSVMAVARW